MTAPARPAAAALPLRGRRAALAVPALAVALLAACGTQTAGGTADGLPVLRIGGSGGGAVPAEAMDARSGGGFTLDGTLPTSPGSAPVARFSDGVDGGDVRAVAAALGIAAQPEKRAHGWVVQDRAGVLKVRDDAGGSWSYSRSGDTCPAYSVDVDSAWGYGVSSCAVAASGGGTAVSSGTGSSDGSASADAVVSTDAPSAVPGSSGSGGAPIPPPTVAPDPTDAPDAPTPVPVDPPGPKPVVTPAPDEATALAAARALLAVAGVDGDPRTYDAGWGGRRSVVVDPRVAGLPTVGVRTVVDVDADGVVGATGWLATATAGDVYPLVTAKDAFDRLSAMPRPMPAIACPETIPPGDAGSPALGAPEVAASPSGAADMPLRCGEMPDVVVTGAQLGLMLTQEGTTPLLVPAWLFEVRGSSEPTPVLAVPDTYLADPTPGSTDPGSTDPGASSAPDPGATGSAVAPPSPVPPASAEPPASGGGGSAAGVTVEKAFLDRDGTTLALVGMGGVCAEYTGVVAAANGDTVTVQIVGRSTLAPDQACIQIAQEVKALVTLSSPLGQRTVVDATTGATVPVTKT